MNRRITIFDQEDFKTNHLLWWSLPLGDEIYSVQTLEAMSPEEREAVLNVGEGDGVMVASGKARVYPFEFLKPEQILIL